MRAIFYDKNEHKRNVIKLSALNLAQVQEIALNTLFCKTARFAVLLRAESDDDINIVYNRFHGVPTPTSYKNAKWSGEFAMFILQNLTPDCFED